MNIEKLFVVLAPSAARGGNCLLGSGSSRKNAIADACGEGGKLPRGAWIEKYNSIEHAAEETGFSEEMLCPFV